MRASPRIHTAIASSSWSLPSAECFSTCHLVIFYFLFYQDFGLHTVGYTLSLVLWNGHGVPRPDNSSVRGIGNL